MANGDTMARLERIARYGTRYEITATKAGEATLLIGYTPRLSRPGLIDMLRRVGPEVVGRLAIGDKDRIAFGTKPRPWAETAGWRIAFSGRTQREAIINGEHPFVAERAAEVA